MSDNVNLLLVGTGAVAREHLKVLQALRASVVVVGRSSERALEFEQSTGTEALAGGIENYLRTAPVPNRAVVSVGADDLCSVTSKLLEAGVQELLVEKPGGLDVVELRRIEALAAANSAQVYIAYNRRFYNSVYQCREFIEADGGVLSFHFDFTEFASKIHSMNKSARILERLFEGNSTHVVDLAFFLGGFPEQLSGTTVSTLDWHPRGSRFVGHGTTNSRALFSYHANWDAPGRWSLELMTSRRKLILRPIETLQVQQVGSFEIETLEIDELDRKYKPGFYLQMQAFLELAPQTQLLTVQQQLRMMEKVYSKICPDLDGSRLSAPIVP